MQSTHEVESGGESLVAKLVKNGEKDIVELTYRNARGDTQVGMYWGGLEVSTRASLADGSPLTLNGDGFTSLPNYLTAYGKLGPELREKIPTGWKRILGTWLSPRE